MVQELTADNFAEAVSSGTVLVDFWAPWCAPCRMQAPILDTVAKKMGDAAKIVKVDVDSNPAAAQQYGVQSIPTLVLLVNGVEVRRFVGVQAEGALTAAFEQAL
ncbi:MAG: thioredoxin [Nitrospiraceae bacterium]|nr:thioredoxin [Nitrospiraceae bacterium]